jgi:hypothetical protein
MYGAGSVIGVLIFIVGAMIIVPRVMGRGKERSEITAEHKVPVIENEGIIVTYLDEFLESNGLSKSLAVTTEADYGRIVVRRRSQKVGSVIHSIDLNSLRNFSEVLNAVLDAKKKILKEPRHDPDAKSQG